MAQSHKFKTLDALTAVFPDVPWRASAGNKVWIFDQKADEYVEVNEGDYVVSIGDRYEVTDTKPDSAKTATAPKTEAKATDSDESETRPNASAVSDGGGIDSGVATKTNE